MSVSQLYPDEGPTLNLNFAGSRILDPRITFTRTSSGTYVGSDGLIKIATADQPRFDHRYVNGQIESLGLLMEESRTNLFTYSEQFDNANWSKDNAGITTNTTATTAPDGTTNAEKLIEDTANAQHYAYQFIAEISTGSVYTLSCFVKAAERTQVSLTSFGEGYSAYDLSNGTIIQTGNNLVSITPYPNGWYRCSATITKTNDTGNFYILVWNNTNSYQGNGTSGIYVWGAQLEQGYFPTSYIPTTTATVTRTLDYARMTGSNFSSWYNPTEGTFNCEFDFLGDKSTTPGYENGGGYPGVYYVDDGTNGNCMGLAKDDDQLGGNPTHSMFVECFLGGGSSEFRQYALGSSSAETPNIFSKSTQAYKKDDIVFYINNTLVGTDTSANIPTVNRLLLGNLRGYPNAYSSPMSGHIRSLSYYPTRLSNTILQNLTK